MTKTRTKSRTKAVQADEAPTFIEGQACIGDFDIAPENPRAKEPADDGIPQVAGTIAAAGLIERVLVRSGRAGERPLMVLNGRRRLLAARRLLADGRVDETYSIPYRLATNKAAEAAALLLPSEHLPLNTADLIVAIGKLRKAKMSTSAIAKALGYDENEIRQRMHLSTLHPKALLALRKGRIGLKEARLLARLKSTKDQAAFAEQALTYGLSEYQLRQKVTGAHISVEDPRYAFVGAERYAAAGGRTESDLFGELPDVLLDAEILDTEWKARARRVMEVMQAARLGVFLSPYRTTSAPDGFDYLDPYVRVRPNEPEQAQRLDEAQDAQAKAANALSEGGLHAEDADDLVVALAQAKLALAKIHHPARTIGAVTITPCRHHGLALAFSAVPLPEAEDDDEEDDAGDIDQTGGARRAEIEMRPLEISVEGRSHVLHETYTDIATRGLIRDLADNPAAALSALIAQLFKHVGLEGHVYAGESALTIKADRYHRHGFEPLEALDGEVRARIEARRQAYLASGLRPIPWVASLPHGEKMAMLAELVAVTLDLREGRTTSLRPAARVEAMEIADLSGSDISAHWSPDEAFLKVHGKAQLMALLLEMGADETQAKGLKKDPLVTFVAEEAAERRWAPAVLTWQAPASSEEETAEETAADASDQDVVEGAEAPGDESAVVEPIVESEPLDIAA